jgi:glutamate racemase
VQEIEAPLLVPLIEAGEHEYLEATLILNRYLSKFDSDIEALVLGCTHYPILLERIVDFFGKKLPIVDSGHEAAKKFVNYLKNHPYIEKSLEKNHKRSYYTTGDTLIFQELGSIFLGEKIQELSRINLS